MTGYEEQKKRGTERNREKDPTYVQTDQTVPHGSPRSISMSPCLLAPMSPRDHSLSPSPHVSPFMYHLAPMFPRILPVSPVSPVSESPSATRGHPLYYEASYFLRVYQYDNRDNRTWQKGLRPSFSQTSSRTKRFINISSDGSSCSWKKTRATGCPEKVLYLTIR